MSADLGKILIVVGLMIAIIGAVLFFFEGKLDWIGHLPGDISVKRENFSFYFPITTLLIVNALIWLIIRVFRR
jgi:hypothetical protein